MKQFILESEPDKDGTIRLKDNDYRYLVRVRRLAAGEFFPAILPDGKETLVKILSINRGILTGRCTFDEENLSPSAPLHSKEMQIKPETKLPPIILFQALPKADKMDLIVRQAAEGGITEIVPFVSEFSVAKINADGQKILRWERIIKEARQQSGSKTATSVRRPLTMNELFKYWEKLNKTAEAGALGLLFHHSPCRLPKNGKERGLEKESLHGYLNSIPGLAALAIGPEGGFSDKEVSLFIENSFKPLTIGDTILRTETAALYCAAAIKILLLEKDSWELKQVETNCG